MRIDHAHDVVSGADSDKSTIYIDRRIPQFSPRLKDKAGRPANLWKYLALHETKEAQAMAKGMEYVRAHNTVATPAEKQAVDADGVSWKLYSDEMDGYLDKIEREKVTRPPPKSLHIDPKKAVAACHKRKCR